MPRFLRSSPFFDYVGNSPCQGRACFRVSPHGSIGDGLPTGGSAMISFNTVRT